MPRIGQSNRYDGGASHTLLSITGAAGKMWPAARTATNAGMSDIEEAVRAILKACAELSAAQAALDHTPDATTAASPDRRRRKFGACPESLLQCP